VVDLKQRGEILEGAVTVNGNRIRVQGRFNAEKSTVYLKGVEDENITFRGDYNGSDISGTGKLGAGKLPETWKARK
jgi:hypothetical protein